MPTNSYVSVAEFKTRFYPTGIADVDDDLVIESVLEGVSRWIDVYCGRRFYRNAADETRYYTAEFADLFFCPDDIGSLTTLATDEDGDRTYETTWSATDYDLEPFNAALESQAQPYTRIAVTPSGNYTFPIGIAKGIKLVGKFGYAAATPKKVHEACILQAMRLFKRKDAPFGVTGSAELGQMLVIPKLDPDVEMMLQPLVRLHVGAL